jgi:hypothetical protein
MSTVTKIGALGKIYGYSPEKKALMGKCTYTIQKMGPHILKKGVTLRNVLVQLPKEARQWKMYQYSFSLSTKTLAITTVYQYIRKASAICCRFFT